MAEYYVGERSVAEEVAQDAWTKALAGLDGFEGRSSFRTWLYRILLNTARSRARRESRTVPFADVVQQEVSADTAAFDASSFQGPGDVQPGHWGANPPRAWAAPEAVLLGRECLDLIRSALAELPEAQRLVVELRDVREFGAEEVCNILEISESNQRVLLHRGRSKIRRALDDYL
jgi:RNA polymerase sigma-70 factor (ECF subfamily)